MTSYLSGIPLRRAGRLAALVAAGVLAGCSSGVTTVGPSVSERYTPRALTEANSEGDLYTVIIGNPFDVPQATLNARVTSVLAESHFGPDVVFETREPDEPRGYRLVVLFNAARAVNRHGLCTRDADAEIETRKGGPVDVIAVFCLNKRYLTAVNGHARGVRGIEDHRFRELMAQVGLSLFPPQDPRDANDPDGFDI